MKTSTHRLDRFGAFWLGIAFGAGGIMTLPGVMPIIVKLFF